MNGIWENNHLRFSTDEVAKKIFESNNCIVILDGPSFCGKSTLIRTIASLYYDTTIISDEEIPELLIDRSSQKNNRIQQDIENYSLVCFDDIDLLGGRQITQACLAQRINAIAKDKTVVISGINIEKNTSILFNSLVNKTVFIFIS